MVPIPSCAVAVDWKIGIRCDVMVGSADVIGEGVTLACGTHISSSSLLHKSERERAIEPATSHLQDDDASSPINGTTPLRTREKQRRS